MPPKPLRCLLGVALVPSFAAAARRCSLSLTFTSHRPQVVLVSLDETFMPKLLIVDEGKLGNLAAKYTHKNLMEDTDWKAERKGPVQLCVESGQMIKVDNALIDPRFRQLDRFIRGNFEAVSSVCVPIHCTPEPVVGGDGATGGDGAGKQEVMGVLCALNKMSYSSSASCLPFRAFDVTDVQNTAAAISQVCHGAVGTARRYEAAVKRANLRRQAQNAATDIVEECRATAAATAAATARRPSLATALKADDDGDGAALRIQKHWKIRKATEAFESNYAANLLTGSSPIKALELQLRDRTKPSPIKALELQLRDRTKHLQDANSFVKNTGANGLGAATRVADGTARRGSSLGSLGRRLSSIRITGKKPTAPSDAVATVSSANPQEEPPLNV